MLFYVMIYFLKGLFWMYLLMLIKIFFKRIKVKIYFLFLFFESIEILIIMCKYRENIY